MVNPYGAEVCSIKYLHSGTEFIWQADPHIWARHAPVLFPFVGRLKNLEYRHYNHTYKIEPHGFARDLVFEVIEQKQNSVKLELSDSDYTLQRYPFKFSFKVKYTLELNKLTMGFEVYNHGDASMPVSFGGHPAFNISSPEDSIIRFENDNNPESFILKNNVISNQTQFVTDGAGTIFVKDDIFNSDAFIFKNLQSKWIKLESKTNSKSVKVNIEGWPYVGIWAKPGANFVCIEPWEGLADNEAFNGYVSEKEGIIMIEPSKSYSNSFEMEFGV